MFNPLNPQSVLPWEKDFQMEYADLSWPGVSIVIPIYNSGAFLEKTIRSLLCNDLTGCELIVMDGGSNDDTGTILEHYAEHFAVCVSEKDKGQSDAINKGFEAASMPILYWLNGDDIILPNALNRARECFTKNPGTEVVVGNAYMTEKDFSPIRHFVFNNDVIKFESLLDYASKHLIQPSVFFSRTAWDKVGPVELDLHYAMDADLFIHMAREFEFLHLEHDIAYSVYHEDCKTRGKRGESITELALVQARYGGFKEARNTLDILVSMFNEQADQLAAQPEAPPPQYAPAQPGEVDILRQQVQALKDDYKKNAILAVESELLL